MARQRKPHKILTGSQMYDALMARMSGSERQVLVKNGSNPVRVLKQASDKLRITPICWGIPVDEVMFSIWFSNFINLRLMPWDDVMIPVSTYLPEARNFIHDKFLSVSTCEWLVMLDSDVLPPPDYVDRLLAHKLPMVGGWYRSKGGLCPPVVYDFGGYDDQGVSQWNQRKEEGTGLEKVDGAGAGCWLMNRAVAQAIGEKPYDMNKGGEDLVLCLKVKEKGFPIYIDWSINCAHAGVGIT